MKNIVNRILRFLARKVEGKELQDENLSSYLIGDHIFQTTRKTSKKV